MNMPTSQNRSNCAFRHGFLRLVTDPTAQSGLKSAQLSLSPPISLLVEFGLMHEGLDSREHVGFHLAVVNGVQDGEVLVGS